MMRSKLLNLSGQVREIVNNKIIGDDKAEIDINEKRYISNIVPFISQDSIPIKRTIIDAQDAIILTLLQRFNFDIKFRKADLKIFNKLNDLSLYNKLLDFSMQYKHNDVFQSMILCGKESFGCGKTYAINALANYWFGFPMVSILTNKFNEIVLYYEGVKYHSIREEDLILRVLAAYKKEPKETELDIYEELDCYDILAIDDIGKYAPSNLEFYRRVMFQIIDTRYNQGKGVVLSTNFGLADLTKFFGVAISDRLNEMSKDFQIELKGKSYRNNKG